MHGGQLSIPTTQVWPATGWKSAWNLGGIFEQASAGRMKWLQLCFNSHHIASHLMLWAGSTSNRIESNRIVSYRISSPIPGRRSWKLTLSRPLLLNQSVTRPFARQVLVLKGSDEMQYIFAINIFLSDWIARAFLSSTTNIRIRFKISTVLIHQQGNSQSMNEKVKRIICCTPMRKHCEQVMPIHQPKPTLARG